MWKHRVFWNNFATSIQKVSEGMTVAGSIASNAGVQIDELAAAIGTMTAVTQRSGNEAGRAFRSILMNIRQIKGETEDGEIIDDEALSKSAKALSSVGIKVHEVRNGIEELRNPMEVLKDLSNVWSSLSSMDQAPIIDAIGGKYRGNQLVALVENFGMYENMLTSYMDSVNSALDENAKRQQGWEQKANKFSNAVSKMWDNTISTDGIKLIIDLGTATVTLVDKVGLLTTAFIALNIALAAFGKMTVINTALATFSNSLLTLKLSAITTTTAINVLNLALKTFYPLLIAAPIIYIVSQIRKHRQELEDITVAQEGFNNALKDFQTSLDPQKLNDAANALENLKQATNYDKSIESLRKLKEELATLDTSSYDNGVLAFAQGVKINELERKIKPFEESRDKFNSSVGTYTTSGNIDAMLNYKKGNARKEIPNKTYSTISGTSSSPPTPYTSKLEDYINTMQLIAQIESELTSTQKARDLASEQDRIPLIQKEIQLQNDLIKLNESLLSQQKDSRQQLANQISAFSAVTVASDLETLNVDTDKYNSLTDKQKENLDNLITSFTNLNKSINSSKNSIDDSLISIQKLGEEITKTQETIVKTSLKSIADSVSSSIKSIQAEQEAIIDSMESALDRYKETQSEIIERKKEELAILKEQYNIEDRLQKLRDLDKRLADVLKDKRFAVIDEATGKEILTHNTALYDELSKERENLLKEFQREDIVSAKEKEISDIQKTRDLEIRRQQREIDITKQNYQSRINNYEGFKSVLSNMQNMEIQDLQKNIDSKISELKRYEEVWKLHQDELLKLKQMPIPKPQQPSGGGGGGSYTYTSGSGTTVRTNANPSGNLYNADGSRATAAEAARQILINAGKFHTGLDTGKFAGNINFDPKTETIAKLLKGEIVMTQPQFNNIIPNMMKAFVPNSMRNPQSVSHDNKIVIENLIVKVNDGNQFVSSLKNVAIAYRG